jgi:hypothetical protein
MFDDMLVTGELLPLRKAASAGDLDAMFMLTNQVLEGKNTRACGDTAFRIINVMFDHEAFKQNLPRAWGVYLLCSRAEYQLYREGKNSYRQYITRSCDYLQWLIEMQTSAPRRLWNYGQLERCIVWLRENEARLHKIEIQ